MSTTVNIPTVDVIGTTTNNNAAAGEIGEYIEAFTQIGSAVSLTTATAANIASISLTHGDWDVSGVLWFNANGAAVITNAYLGITPTSATLPSAGTNFGTAGIASSLSATGIFSLQSASFRISLAATTTIYIVAYSTFTISTNSAYGGLRARRVR